ncbi:MAG: hypothetical protein ACQEVA_23650 [Myxococcota bacterium]
MNNLGKLTPAEHPDCDGPSDDDAFRRRLSTIIARFRLYLIATTLALAATLAGGCKTPAAGGQQDVFTWRDALSSSREDAQNTLGEFEQCQETSPYWIRGRRGDWPGTNTWTRCSVADNARQHHEEYRVRAITYLNERPIIVRLEPHSKTNVSRELLDDWGLPRLPFEHQLRPNDAKTLQAHLRYLVLDPADAGAIRGIDIYPSIDRESPDGGFDDYDTVGFVRVYAEDETHAMAWLIEQAGPPPATPELVLPRLDSSLSPDDHLGDIYARVGLKSFQIGDRPVYPALPPDAPMNRSDAPMLPRAELTGENARWLEDFEAPVAKRRTQAETLRRDFEPKLHIAIDRSLPARELLQLVQNTHDAETSVFALIGRNVSGTDEQFEPGRGEVVESNFTFLPREARPKQRPQDRGLDLTVSIQSDGFAIDAAGEELPPLDGCPDDGPTICRRDTTLDADELVAEARRLQKAGELGASQQRVETILATYDWPRLYDTLTTLKEQYPDETVIAIEVAAPETIVAVVAQVMRTSRYKLRAPNAEPDACAESFKDTDALRAAVPCAVDGESHPLRELFDETVLLEAPSRAK